MMRKLVSWWDSTTLRSKIVATSVVCLLVPLLISTVLSNYNSKNVLMDTAISNSQETMKMVELNLTSLMNNILYITNYIQFDSEMNTLIREGTSNENVAERALNYSKITNRLNSVTNLLNDIYITILTEDNESPAHINGYTNYSTYNYQYELFTKEPWFPQLRQSKAYETMFLGGQPNYMLSSQETSPYVMTIARKIQPATVPIGYVIISLKETDFHKAFAQISGNQEMMLVDANATILSHPDGLKIGQVFPYADRISLEENDVEVTKIDGEQFLLASYKLTYSDWTLVSLTRYKDATEKINFIQRTNLLIQVSFFSAFLLILILFIRRFTQPLAKLGRIATEFETGNLTVRAHINGNNEISKVGRSFDQMLDRIELMLHQIVEDQAKKRMLELETLQAQIHPHFLFNILNSIRLKILMKDDQENAELIQSLSHLLRMTINRNNEFIKLQQEVDIVNHYIKLMNMRQREPIQLEVEMEEQVGMIEVPRLFIQPLIENAYIHSFNQGGGTVVIRAIMQQQHVIISIIDNGKGMTEEQIKQLLARVYEKSTDIAEGDQQVGFSGIGVKNVFERLQIIYGQSVKLYVESEIGKGTTISLHIPIIAGEARYV